MSSEDAVRGADIGDAHTAGPPPGLDSPALSDDERIVLEILMGCRTSRTLSQLCSSSGLRREDVAAAVEALRSGGLITRFNTLVESYAACFPGIDV